MITSGWNAVKTRTSLAVATIVALSAAGAVPAAAMTVETAGGGANATVPLAVSGAGTGTAYHVDCEASVPGIGTEASPLSNLDAVADLILEPGDSLLFKRGTACHGAVTTTGSGTAEAPIVMDAYGDESAPLPALHGDGVEQTVLLDNQEYWEIRRLEITNADLAAGDQFRSMRRGVVVKNTDAGKLSHFRLEELYIHDVTGEGKKDLGGSGAIQLEVYPGSVESWFDDTVIANNRIEDVNRSGINMSTAWLCRAEMAWDSGYCTTGNTARNPWVPSTGLVIRDNVVSGVGGDGIVVQMNRGALVEGNVVSDAANRANQGSNAGVWAWNADDTTFRGNTVSHTRKLAGNNDGTSFDIDYGTRNTVFEHNVSYANEGGMVFFCGCSASWLPNAGFASEGVYRYNVTIGEISRVGFLSGATDGAFYNNTVVITDDSQADFLSVNASGSSVLFANNLVVSTRDGGVTTTPYGSPNVMTWRNNAFYSVGGASSWPGTEDDANIYRDVADLPAGAQAVYEALAGADYGAQTGHLDLSALDVAVPELAGAGLPVAPEGTVDLAGNPVPTLCDPDIGAIQFSAIDPECGDVGTLSAGDARELVLPATQTVRVSADLSADATLAVTNGRGLSVTAAADSGAAVIRTTANDNTVTVTCEDGTCADVSVATISDVVVDGSFESLPTAYRDNRTSPWTTWNTGRSTVAATGATALTLTPGSTGAGSELRGMPVRPSETYLLQGWVRSSVAGKAQGVSLGIKWGAGTEETGTAFNAVTSVAGQWQLVSTTVAIPSDVDAVTVYCYQPAASGTSQCDDVTLTAAEPAESSITQAPADASVMEGDSAHFEVRTGGDHAAIVTWQRNAGNGWETLRASVNGFEQPVTGAWLAVNDVTAGQDGSRYRAVVTDGVTGAVRTSDPATLTVLTARGTETGALVGLELATGPTRDVYLVGDALDPAGVSVVAVFETGRYHVSDATLLDIDDSAFVTYRVGTYDVPVSFTAEGVTKSTTFPVEVRSAVTSWVPCADLAGTVTASFHQTQYGTHPGTNACDGSASSSWSTWPGAAARPGDVLTIEFADPVALAGAEIDWLESVPAGGAVVEWRNDAGEWATLGEPLDDITLVGTALTSTVTQEQPVEASAARLSLTYGSDAGGYVKVSELRFSVAEVSEPSSDAAVATIEVDGAALSEVDPGVDAYRAAWTDVQSVPVVTATAVHPGATVEVVQATVGSPTAVVTVTAANRVDTATYRVTFDLPTVTGLALDTGAVRTEYSVGDTFDPAGLLASATFSHGQVLDVSGAVTMSAPDLSAAGKKAVTVRYTWGGSQARASFDIVVKPAPTVVEPDPRLSLASLTLRAGGDIEVDATGLTPRGEAVLELHSTPVELARVTANGDGDASISATIPPTTAPGKHSLVLIDTASAVTVSVEVTVLAADAGDGDGDGTDGGTDDGGSDNGGSDGGGTDDDAGTAGSDDAGSPGTAADAGDLSTTGPSPVTFLALMAVLLGAGSLVLIGAVRLHRARE
ncbi:MAG: bacterial Ig-like domain-containing protein [Demequina sp.]|uniref:bacterial Ig-like domain-containing protein n=1 Tax=Demequina sp. TaxID=2050685 RepID=UPI003A8A9B5A